MTSRAYRDCADYAASLGLIEAGIDGRGHMRFANPETGESVPVSMSMTGRDRHYAQNTKAALRRLAGADSRGREAVEGERRERRHLGRLTSGFNLAAAARERRRVAHTDRVAENEQARSQLEARESAALDELHTIDPRRNRAEAERLARLVVDLRQQIDALR